MKQYGFLITLVGCSYAYSQPNTDAHNLNKQAVLDILNLSPIEHPMRNSLLRSLQKDEVYDNLRAIKTAMLAYEQTFDVFVAAKPYPPKGPGKKPWKSQESGGFSIIGWQPDGEVTGTYWVDVERTNFTATGIIDVDGDGSYQTYVATKSSNPKPPPLPKPKVLSRSERIGLAKRLRKAIKQDKSAPSNAPAVVLGSMVYIAKFDKSLSSAEQKALLQYRKGLKVSLSLEESLSLFETIQHTNISNK